MNHTKILSITVVAVSVLIGSCRLSADELPVGMITLVDWMTNDTVQQQLDLDDQQLDAIKDEFVVVALDMQEFCELTPLPDMKERFLHNFDEIEEKIAEVNNFRIKAMQHAERRIFEILSDEQDEILLGRLIKSAGYHALLESPELRRRVELTDTQFVKLDEIYREPYRQAYKKMAALDKWKNVETYEEMERMSEANNYVDNSVTQIVQEIGEKLFKEIRELEKTSEDRAVVVLTPVQTAMIKKLKAKAPKDPQPDNDQ